MNSMTAIIDGKRYDPTKANFIGDARRTVYHSDGGDFYGTASLYRTESGKYFLQADGKEGSWISDENDCTDVSQEDSNHCRRIYTLSLSQAQAWAEKYLPTDIVEDVFADTIVDA